jgi:hypothetical protein
MRTIKNISIVLILSALFAIKLSAQESAIVSSEKELTRLEEAMLQTGNQRTALTRDVAAYAKEIDNLKAEKSLSYFQQQRLERLLKDSQDITRKIEKLDSELQSLQKSYVRTGNKLVALYDAEISKNVKQLENQQLASGRQRELLADIERLRVRSESVKERFRETKIAAHKIPRLQIEADDSPKQIEQKADLLKDQEDKLRASATKIEKQAKELKGEVELRNRMNDLVTDLSMFDQQEEALGNVNTFDVQDIGGDGTSEEFAGPTTGRGQIGLTVESGLLVGQKDFDFSTLSPEQLEDVIASLKKQEERMKAQADSLAQQAELFYKAAQDMKKP